VTKGIVGSGSDAATIVDPARAAAPDGFWIGMRLRLLDPSGTTVGEAAIAEFDRAANALKLQNGLPASPLIGQSYELVSDEEAPVLGIRWMLGLAAGQPIPPVTVRLGTTRGTNALLTRCGAKTALVTTRGFYSI
jgi:5-oxoprolinase (ATP-hydrolysing)